MRAIVKLPGEVVDVKNNEVMLELNLSDGIEVLSQTYWQYLKARHGINSASEFAEKMEKLAMIEEVKLLTEFSILIK